MGHTEVSSQSLRRTLKQLQAQDPQTETSRLEEEYLVRSPILPLTHHQLVPRSPLPRGSTVWWQ